MIALRAPFYLELGIATALTTGLLLLQPRPQGPSAPELAFDEPDDPPDIRSQSTAQACDNDEIASIVIRGQFSAQHPEQGFAISFAGTAGRYTAFTDKRGYFEVRIPREDFMGDLCELPKQWKRFSDDQMALTYRLDFE